jgi:hypothetical protein
LYLDLPRKFEAFRKYFSKGCIGTTSPIGGGTILCWLAMGLIVAAGDTTVGSGPIKMRHAKRGDHKAQKGAAWRLDGSAPEL